MTQTDTSTSPDREMVDPRKIVRIMEAAKLLANQYRSYTGKPLGITGEIGEFEAGRLLDLELAPARTPGYDAKDASGTRYQIKTRCVFDGSNPGQRMGSIRLKHEWDAILLVILDEDLDPMEIHEAQRPVIEVALKAPGSKARNERGQLGVTRSSASPQRPSSGPARHRPRR